MPSPALDGSAHNSTSGTGTCTVTLSTTLGNDVIVVDVEWNVFGPTTPTSANLTFTHHAGSGNMDRYYAIAPSTPLSGEVITVNQSGGSNFLSVTASAWTGVNNGGPWDSGGPQTGSGATTESGMSITTFNPVTTVLASFRFSSQSNPTAGSTFTAIQLNGDFLLTEYQQLSSSQTINNTPTWVGTGAGNANGGIVDALVGIPLVFRPYTLMSSHLIL